MLRINRKPFGVSRFVLAVLLVVLVGTVYSPARAQETMTITQVRGAKVDTSVKVRGTVTAGTKVFDTKAASIYIQDTTSGISVVFPKGGLPTLVEGDTVEVSGKLKISSGRGQIVAASVDDVKKVNTDAPKALTATTIKSADAHKYAGQLVQLEAKIVAGNSMWNDFFVITDSTDISTGLIKVNLIEATKIDADVLALGQTICITGIVDATELGFSDLIDAMLLPRSSNDIKFGQCS